jgi:hypothetical protein
MELFFRASTSKQQCFFYYFEEETGKLVDRHQSQNHMIRINPKVLPLRKRKVPSDQIPAELKLNSVNRAP